MLRPRSIAILGASARRTASGNDAIAHLRELRFDGRIVAVHPDAATIAGASTVRNVEDLPADLDTALVSLPAASVVPALRMLADRGCRSAVVPSVGMGATDERELAALTDSSAMRVLGPNCLGFLNYTDRVALWIAQDTITREEPGHTALVAQSGSACIFIVRAAPGVRFSKVISSGNELGVSTSDCLSWLADDPATGSVGIVVESLRNVPAFIGSVEKLRRARKPIVALKVGRSRNGIAATVAHTGALVGAGRAYDALFAELDIPTVGDYDEMASVLECFQGEATRASRGPRVAIVTISGGQAAMAADLAEACGVDLAELAPTTAGRLRELAPDVEVNNPYDIGASLSLTRERYADCLRAMARDPSVDIVIPVLDAAQTLSEHEVSFARRYFEAVADAVSGGLPAPLVVSSSSSLAIHELSREWLGDVPILRGIRNALVAARALARNRAPIVRPAGGRVSPAVLDELRGALTEAGGAVPHQLGRRLLAAYGVPLVPSALASTEAEAAAAADRLGYPVVVKIASSDVPHRSELGGVVTGVDDADAVRRAVAEITACVAHARPEARIEGFEVQPQIGSSVEVMAGFVADPVFGATVSVGCGGTLVELMPDVAVAAAPMTREAARRAIGQTLIARLARGFRQLIPVTDLEPLAAALEAFSHLAADFADILAEVDLNPILVEHATGRAVVVDALFVARPSRVGP